MGVFLGSAPRIEDNSISRNRGWIAGGILVSQDSHPVISGNSIKHNFGPAALWKDRTSSCTLQGNHISGRVVTWPAKAPKLKPLPPGRVLRVPAKYRTIQGAMRAARDGDTVVVAPGLYKENLDFQGKRITVRSQDPESAGIVGSTIIEGDGAAPTVQFLRGEPRDAVLRGFTIRNGSGRGGIHIVSSSPTIAQNVISILRNNPDMEWEYGIEINAPPSPYQYLRGQLAAPLITGNTITGNRGRGGISMFFASPVISDNVISRNEEGGIMVEFSSPLISDNRVEGNSGAGLHIEQWGRVVVRGNLIAGNAGGEDCNIFLGDFSEAIIDGNTIRGNTQKQGVAGLFMLDDCRPQVTNNVFADNSGGAIFAQTSQPQILNDTFVGNGINAYDAAKVTITNCILFDSDLSLFDDFSEWVMTYSIDNRFQREGEGNQFCDPLFAGESDYHLLATSPAIDAGTAVDLQTDIEGTSRPQGGGYDIGAYEYVSGR